jgi:hypothetical protein
MTRARQSISIAARCAGAFASRGGAPRATIKTSNNENINQA